MLRRIKRMLRRISREDCSIPKGFTYETTTPIRVLSADGFETVPQQCKLTGRWKVVILSPKDYEVFVEIILPKTADEQIVKYTSEVDITLSPIEYVNKVELASLVKAQQVFVDALKD